MPDDTVLCPVSTPTNTVWITGGSVVLPRRPVSPELSRNLATNTGPPPTPTRWGKDFIETLGLLYRFVPLLRVHGRNSDKYQQKKYEVLQILEEVESLPYTLTSLRVPWLLYELQFGQG